MVHPHLEEDALLSEEGRLSAALESFWQDFIRRPTTQKTPGRQFIQGPLDELPVWVTRDDDPEHALSFTPNVFLGGLDDDNVVEIPCLHVALSGVAAPGEEGQSLAVSDHPSPARLSADAMVHVEDLGLPSPHYQLFGGGKLHLVWRIEPLRRPGKKAPDAHHHAWNQCLLSWRMAQVKLAMAFAELGADEPSSAYTARLPLPHPATPAKYLDSDAYLVDAAPELSSLRIREVSAPLNGVYDIPAWTKVRPHDKKIPLFLLGKTAWTNSKRFLEAIEPKKAGQRHPAAVTITCVLRWAGRQKEEVLDYLRKWHEKNLDVSQFPYERSQSDELEDLVEWAFDKLVPGGPTRPEPEIRGRYTAKENAIEAVFGFLQEQEATLHGWVGTQEDLAKGATVWAAEKKTGAVLTRDSLQKILPELKKRGLIAVIERVGRTWTTEWHLHPARLESEMRASAGPPEMDSEKSRKNSPGFDREKEGLASTHISQREMDMSIGRPDLGSGGGNILSLEPAPFPDVQDIKNLKLVPRPGPPVGPMRGLLGQGDSNSLEDGGDLKPSESGGVFDFASGGEAPSSEAAILDLAESSRRLGPEPPRRDEPPLPLPSPQSSWLPPALPPRLAHLHRLCGLGFSVILLRPGTKEPMRARWAPAQKRAQSASVLQEAMLREPDANLAIVCGEVSGVVAVDLDSAEALAWATENLPPTPLRSKTARGEHWFYRHPKNGPVRNRARLRGFAVDVKGDGGYVVAPGSVHPSGAVYEALGDWESVTVSALPCFESSWLLSEDEELEPGLLPGEDESSQAMRWLRKIREAAQSGNWRALRKGPRGPLEKG